MKTLIVLIVLITWLAVLTMPETSDIAHAQSQTTQKPSASEPPIKVTIQTAQDSMQTVTDRFHVGDEILVPITLTNTTTNPVDICDSADVYQDLPRLTKDGLTVPVMKWQRGVQRILQRDATCEKLNLPEPINLNPNEPKIVDWLVLVDSKVSTGSDAWYDSLPPGKYELSIQRRLACCDGPKVQSNKISFEILP